jgi:hypothetical protein
MKKNETNRMYFVVLYFFLLTGIFCEWCSGFLDAHQIDHRVLLGGDILLFALTIISILMFSNALKNSNPNVFIRSVMGSTFLKLMVLAISIAVYLYLAGPARSLYAVLWTMALYIFYTVIEVRGVLKMNKQVNGKG